MARTVKDLFLLLGIVFLVYFFTKANYSVVAFMVYFFVLFLAAKSW